MAFCGNFDILWWHEPWVVKLFIIDEVLVYFCLQDFMWSAATAAYQIEGGWDADGNYPFTRSFANTDISKEKPKKWLQTQQSIV